MSIHLSRAEIDSFHNNVVCLKLCGENLELADIKWSADNDGVRIRDFKNEGEFSFNDGVLLALEYNGEFIHGTDKPESIGKNQSKGCVRLNNADVENLAEWLSVGQYVLIRE